MKQDDYRHYHRIMIRKIRIEFYESVIGYYETEFKVCRFILIIFASYIFILIYEGSRSLAEYLICFIISNLMIKRLKETKREINEIKTELLIIS